MSYKTSEHIKSCNVTLWNVDASLCSLETGMGIGTLEMTTRRNLKVDFGVKTSSNIIKFIASLVCLYLRRPHFLWEFTGFVGGVSLPPMVE